MSQAACPHGDAHIAQRVCIHLFRGDASTYSHRFTGTGIAYDLLCPACAEKSALADDETSEPPADLLAATCAACFEAVAARSTWATGERAVLASPAIDERATRLSFQHEMLRVPTGFGAPLRDLVALPGAAASRWVAVTTTGRLAVVDLTARSSTVVADLDGAGVDPAQDLEVVASPDGKLAAVVEARGSSGVVVDLETGDITMLLDRGEPARAARYPVAFAAAGDRVVLVTAGSWNRLEAFDPRTGDPLVRRPSGESQDHQLEYASSGLSVSPDGAWLVDNGFTVEGAGLVSAFSLAAWLDGNPWEPEDGPSKRYLCQRWDFWDGPLTWIDGGTLAVFGYGPSRVSMIPAVILFDVATGEPLRWFPGPQGPLVHDTYPARTVPSRDRDQITPDDPVGLLFSIGDDGVSVWDTATGERLLHDAGFQPLRYHPAARQFLTTNPDADLFVVSRLVGSPDSP
jgi:hypothetical protein